MADQRNPFADRLTAYKPTLRDQARNIFANGGYEARRFAANLFGSPGNMGLADWTPLGTAFGLEEAGRKITTPGQRLSGGADIALAMVPIPAARRAKLAKIVANAEAKGVKLSIHHGHRGDLVLSRIEVPKELRGQGLGSSIMRELTDYADEGGNLMALTPSGEFGGSVPRLKQFYGDFGFVPNKGRARDFEISEDMYRLPAPRAE